MKTAPVNNVNTERLMIIFTFILLLRALLNKGDIEELAMKNPTHLIRPGVSPATLQAEDVRHVTAEEAHQLLGQYRAGIWIPYYDLDGNLLNVLERVFGRLRLDVPTDDRKYTQVYQGGVHGYIPRGFKADKGGLLSLQEGEFKTLSMGEAGYCAVGVGGIQNCAVKGGGSLAPELAEAINACKPQAVAFVGDADTALIPDFSRAMLKLANLLKALKLPLLLPRLPVNSPGKGVDDCREALNGQFNAWFDPIVSQAVTVNPQTTQSALAMELLHREVDALKTLTDKSAVTRGNALERSVKLTLGFWKDLPTRQEVERIACDVFGVSHTEFGQLLEAARFKQLDKLKAERQAKAVSVTVPALPVPPVTLASDNLPPIESAEDLLNDTSVVLPPEIIKGLLHQGTKAVLASGSKDRKTWILMCLALCVASGTPFWGLPVTPGRVLYINFEIPRAFFKIRLAKLCEALGIKKPRDFHVWNLRGKAAHLGILMPKIIERVKRLGYVLIVVDPIYKGLGGRDENSAGDMGQLCNELEALTVESNAAVAFAAHFTKGNQAAKNAMDRISGSGVISRDADTIITWTQHDVPGAYTVDATLRNFPAAEPFVIQWAFPLMVRRPDLDPAKLKLTNGRKPSYTVADILPLLKAGSLSTTEWLKAAAQSLSVSKSTFMRLKRDAMATGAVTATVDDKWTLASSPASTPAQGVTGANSTI